MKRIILPILFFALLLFLVAATSVVLKDVYSVTPFTLAHYYLAQIGSAIGVTVSIPPNPFNTLTQQLNEKENTLTQKEKELRERELAIAKEKENRILLYAAGGGGMLLALVLLNFYFDYRRRNSI